MANLSDSEIEKLFSGAPQYFARSEGHGTAPRTPRLRFRGMSSWKSGISLTTPRSRIEHGVVSQRGRISRAMYNRIAPRRRS